MSENRDEYEYMKIISAWRENMCIIENGNGRKFGFKLEDIAGYQGQDAHQLGLKPGRFVRVKTYGDIVVTVRLD